MVYGYLGRSSDSKVLVKTQREIETFAEEHAIEIVEFITASVPTAKMQKQARINVLLQYLKRGDTLIALDLAQLGRNILEALNLLRALKKENVGVRFVKQPELNTTYDNPIQKELFKVYDYFVQTEHAFVSARTKAGLAAVKAKGVKLGRPKGHKNKKRALDDHREEIMQLLNIGVNLTAIRKIINRKLPKNLSYSSYKYFIDHDEELLHARHNFDKGSLLH